MCMYSKNIELQVSDKDIPCLKLLEVVEDANQQKAYLTPYINMRITPDMLSGKTLIKPEYDLDNTINKIYCDCENCVKVKEGFIHTFQYDISIKDLIFNIEVFKYPVLEGVERAFSTNAVKQLGYPYYIYPDVLNITLCKCVIPAGVPFIRGSERIDPYFEIYYASKAIRVTKILHEFTKEDYMEKDVNKIYNFIKNIIENNRI